MEKMFDDTVALVIRKAGLKKKDGWSVVCATEYQKNGNWMLGMNMITSIDDVLDLAEREGLSILMEKTLMKKPKENK